MRHKCSIYIAGDSHPFLVELRAATVLARRSEARACGTLMHFMPEERQRGEHPGGDLHIDPDAISAVSEFYEEDED